MLIDFEPAIRTAIASILSETVIRGCFFHFAQCIWRKVQDLGLVTAYKQNSSLRKTVRRIAALPLMPLNALGRLWHLLRAQGPVDVPRMPELFDYVQTTWINNDALFEPRMWNQFENNGSRTNNSVEGFNFRINNLIRIRRPSIFRLILALQRTQMQNEIGLARLMQGGRARRRQRRYRDSDVRLERLKDMLMADEIDVFKYLDECSTCIKMGKI